MALRKDKIQALKDSLCLDNVDPATRSALNNLVDNLMDLFGDVALPELGELPGISTGEFGFPEDAPFDFPLGGGGPQGFDPLGGFEGGPPGGGEEFGPGGEGGGEQGQPPLTCKELEKHVTFLAKADEEIPAAKNGNPGMGIVKQLVVVPADLAERNKCKEECDERHKEDSKHAREMLNDARTNSMFDPPPTFNGLTFEGSEPVDFRDIAGKHWVKRLSEIENEYRKCLINCDNKPDPEGPKETGLVFIAQNISCEKIEKDTQVVVSGLMQGDPECGEDDLYVMVEACGCD